MIHKLRTPLGKNLLLIIWIIAAVGIVFVASATFVLFPGKASAETIDKAIAAHQPVIILSLIHAGYSLLLIVARLPWWVWIPAVATPTVAAMTQATEEAYNNPNALFAYILGSSVVIVSILLTQIAVSKNKIKHTTKPTKSQ